MNSTLLSRRFLGLGVLGCAIALRLAIEPAWAQPVPAKSAIEKDIEMVSSSLERGAYREARAQIDEILNAKSASLGEDDQKRLIEMRARAELGDLEPERCFQSMSTRTVRFSRAAMLLCGIARDIAGDSAGALRELLTVLHRDSCKEPLSAIYCALVAGKSGGLSRYASRTEWPSAIADYLLGERDAGALIECARGNSDQSDRDRKRQETLAHFCVGRWAESRGNLELARSSYAAVLAIGLKGEIEYLWALGRSARLSGTLARWTPPQPTVERFGFIDRQGEFVLPPRYEYARQFRNGLGEANAAHGAGAGYIDRAGYWRLPPVYELSGWPTAPLVPFQHTPFGEKGYLDPKTGAEVVPAELMNLNGVWVEERFIDGFAVIAKPGADGKPRYGYLAADGRVVVDPCFVSASRFSDGKACVQSVAKGRFHWIRTDGQRAFAAESHYGLVDFSNDRVVWQPEAGGPFGFLDGNGDVAIPAQYRFAGSFQAGVAAVAFANETTSFLIDSAGRRVGMLRFDKLDSFSEERAAVKIDDRWGYIDTSGALVISARYDKAGAFYGGRAKVARGDRWAFVSATGEEICDFLYREVGDFAEGLAEVRLEKLWGYIDATGKLVIPPRFRRAQEFSEGLAAVEVEVPCASLERLEESQFRESARGQRMLEAIAHVRLASFLEELPDLAAQLWLETSPLPIVEVDLDPDYDHAKKLALLERVLRLAPESRSVDDAEAFSDCFTKRAQGFALLMRDMDEQPDDKKWGPSVLTAVPADFDGLKRGVQLGLAEEFQRGSSLWYDGGSGTDVVYAPLVLGLLAAENSQLRAKAREQLRMGKFRFNELHELVACLRTGTARISRGNEGHVWISHPESESLQLTLRWENDRWRVAHLNF